MQIVLRNRRAVPSRLYDFIPIDPCCWRESGFWRRPAPFEQNEIPLKNSVESRDYAHPKVRGQNSPGFLLSHGCALFTAISIIGALCLPDRHRPDKPGDDVSAAATSFAPLTNSLSLRSREFSRGQQGIFSAAQGIHWPELGIPDFDEFGRRRQSRLIPRFHFVRSAIDLISFSCDALPKCRGGGRHEPH